MNGDILLYIICIVPGFLGALAVMAAESTIDGFTRGNIIGALVMGFIPVINMILAVIAGFLLLFAIVVLPIEYFKETDRGKKFLEWCNKKI